MENMTRIDWSRLARSWIIALKADSESRRTAPMRLTNEGERNLNFFPVLIILDVTLEKRIFQSIKIVI